VIDVIRMAAKAIQAQVEWIDSAAQQSHHLLKGNLCFGLNFCVATVSPFSGILPRVGNFLSPR
jgi:hypothetical protein